MGQEDDGGQVEEEDTPVQSRQVAQRVPRRVDAAEAAASAQRAPGDVGHEHRRRDRQLRSR
eukprot:256611-Pyramimonas_sp.AAC.1